MTFEATWLAGLAVVLTGSLALLGVALLSEEERHGAFLGGIGLLLLTGALGIAGVAIFGTGAS